MNRSKYSYLFNFIFVFFGVIYQLFILKYALKYSEALTAGIILIITFLAILIFGYKKSIKTKEKTSITYRIIAIVMLFFTITYACGLIMGFERTAYSLNPLAIISNILMPIVIIVCMEIYRYVTISTTNKKSIMITTTIALIIFEILISIRLNSLLAVSSLFKTLTTIMFPIISKNFLMSYLAHHGELKQTLIYRLPLEIYIYLLPIIPNFNDYIRSMIGICMPVLIYVYISKYLDLENGIYIEKKDSKISNIIKDIIIGIIIVFIALISGFFPLTMLGVGSNSMKPYIEKGDAVIIKKVNSDNKIKVGDIIAYHNKDVNEIIIHRVVKIKKKNNKNIYITKGDANKSEDNIDISLKDIKGIVLFKIKYISRPSIYFKELLNKRSKA